MNNKILISVIIPTFNSSKTLLLTLSSLEKSKFGKDKFEVLVIDDESTDDTQDVIIKFKKTNKLQLNYFKQINSGPGIARNLGLKNARGNVVAFTDADCIVDRNWLSAIYKSIIIDGNTIIGGHTYTNDVSIFPWKVAPIGKKCKITANLAVKYSQLKGIIFCKSFKKPLCEDTDFIIRIQNLGYTFKHVSEMKIMHPLHICNIKQMTERLIYRKDEVLLYKKYGKEINGSFSPIFRPMLFRLSPITIIFVFSLAFFIFTLKMNYILPVFYFCILFIILFIMYFYKYLIISNVKNIHISIRDRAKTFIFLLVYIPTFILTRIIGSINYKFFMV